MSKRNNWEDFKNILEQHHITRCIILQIVTT